MLLDVLIAPRDISAQQLQYILSHVRMVLTVRKNRLIQRFVLQVSTVQHK